MYMFKVEDKDFIEKVNSKNIKAVKDIIVREIIKKHNWDKNKIDMEIEYAIENEAFEFEEHREFDKSGIKSETKDEYLFELGRLYDNFSKERYNKVLNLAKKLGMIKKEEEKIDLGTKSNINVEFYQSKRSNLGFQVKRLVIIAGLVLVAVILLKKIIN